MRCFSDKEWKFFKFVAVIGLVITVVKLCIIAKLYRAITNYEVDGITNMLKAIVVLFVIN